MDSKIGVECRNDIAQITLEGRVDANTAPVLSDELKKLIGTPTKRIVFMARELEYISSAGLRAILFAKQKIGEDTEVFLIAAQPTVLEVIKMSGFDSFVIIQDSFTD